MANGCVLNMIILLWLTETQSVRGRNSRLFHKMVTRLPSNPTSANISKPWKTVKPKQNRNKLGARSGSTFTNVHLKELMREKKASLSRVSNGIDGLLLRVTELSTATEKLVADGRSGRAGTEENEISN